ncbi:MAG: hypothetical protein HRT98_02830 [Mycoplasmatales bacterium]|nr:hypothetical protein [Mycoplasmatales bacterium]
MKKVIDNDILSFVKENWIDPGAVLEFKEIDEIRKMLNDTIEDIETRNKLLEEVDSLSKKIGSQEKIDQMGEGNIEINTNVFYLQDLRNTLKEGLLHKKIEAFYNDTSKGIDLFFRVFSNFKDDGFIEIEGALNQIEYLKHFKLKDLGTPQNIFDFDFHKNYKEVIYIYSCFDKIATLAILFSGSEKIKKIKYTYFAKNLTKDFIEEFPQKKEFIEKTDEFINSKLFKDFKVIRNSITHNHTMPMDEYLTNLYTYVGFYLLTYYAENILNKYF